MTIFDVEIAFGNHAAGRGAGAQLVTLKARDEAEAIALAEEYEIHPDRRVGITAEPSQRWTVYGEVHDQRVVGPAWGFSNGETYATKREARDHAKSASDVIDRLTPLPTFEIRKHGESEVLLRGWSKHTLRQTASAWDASVYPIDREETR